MIRCEKAKGERPPHPKENAGFFSKITYSWLLDILLRGRKQDLGTDDLYRNLPEHCTEKLVAELGRYWQDEIKWAKRKDNLASASLIRPLFRMFGLRLALYGILIAFSKIILK